MSPKDHGSNQKETKDYQTRQERVSAFLDKPLVTETKDAGNGQAEKPRRMRMGGPAFGRPVEKARDFKGTLKRLLQLLSPHRATIGVAFLFTALGSAFGAYSPKVLGRATTELFRGFLSRVQGAPDAAINFTVIGNTLLLLGSLYVASSIFNYIQQIAMLKVSQATVYQMRKGIMEKLSRLPLRYFDSQTHGEILSRVTNDVDTVSSTLQESLSRMISSVVSIVGVLVMMLSISPIMTLVTLCALPFSVVITAQTAKRSQRYFAGQQKALGTLNGHIEEMYTGHRVVKAFGREEASKNKFSELNQNLVDYSWKAQFISGVLMPIMGFMNNLSYVFVCVMGSVFVTRGTLAIGDVQAFMSYSRQFTQPIVSIAGIANIIQSSIAAAERVFEVLDEEEEVPDPLDAEVIERAKGSVRMDRVKFGYSPGNTLMPNLNIDVQSGQTIAIVGPTGAGKTTLVNLLMRFYDVHEGAITVDGVNIQAMRRGDLRAIFGMVLQDTWLFNGTIRENIAYGRKGASEDDIVRAAKIALADPFIRMLPDGYDTVLKEDGANLSQGQMQLMTIARAVLADPAILILDEATSSVDTRTEIQIQRAMTNLMRGRTNFVIAHRLSTIRDADLILVMDEGDIVEQGTHKELLDQDGFYAELYNSQFVGSANARNATSA